MYYHIKLWKELTGSEVRLDLTEKQLQENYINPLYKGKAVVINGITLYPNRITRVTIRSSEASLENLVNKIKARGQTGYLPSNPKWEAFDTAKDVTDNFIDKPFDVTKPKTNNGEFVNSNRIEELKNLKSPQYEFAKLIKYCEEINICYKNECYLAVAMLTRAIIDHIPPIFNAFNFKNVYGQNGSRSFKEQMTHLDNSLRKIADSYLHSHIRSKEALPNNTQVNFSQDIDVLLAEVCRQIK